MTTRVSVCLRDYRDRGYVRSIEGPGQDNLWGVRQGQEPARACAGGRRGARLTRRPTWDCVGSWLLRDLVRGVGCGGGTTDGRCCLAGNARCGSSPSSAPSPCSRPFGRDCSNRGPEAEQTAELSSCSFRGPALHLRASVRWAKANGPGKPGPLRGLSFWRLCISQTWADCWFNSLLRESGHVRPQQAPLSR
jgi:hypothetical protein